MTVERKKMTTIAVTFDTRDKLDSIVKNKRETYDLIIRRLLYVYETRQGESLEKEFDKLVKATDKRVKGTKIKG